MSFYQERYNNVTADKFTYLIFLNIDLSFMGYITLIYNMHDLPTKCVVGET